MHRLFVTLLSMPATTLLPKRQTNQRRDIYWFTALSGALLPILFISWIRLFTSKFGAAHGTSTMVITAWLVGLGVGSLLSHRINTIFAKRIKSQSFLKTYGLIQLVLGCTLILTLLAHCLPTYLFSTQHYEYGDGDNVYTLPIKVQLFRTFIVGICVLPPSVLLGTTFPLLCESQTTRTSFPSSIYAASMFGACTGLILFTVCLTTGLNQIAIMIAVIIGYAAIGTYFIKHDGHSVPRDSLTTDTSQDEATPTTTVSAATLLIAAIIAGLMAGSLEGDLLKRIPFLLDSNTAATGYVLLWSFLSFFLGGCTVRAIPRLQFWHIKIACGLAVVIYLLTTIRAYALIEYFTQEKTASTTAAGNHVSASLQLFMFIGLFVFPPMYLLSLLFPYACNRMQVAGKHISTAHGLYCLSFCVGVISFTRIAPQASIFFSLKLVFVILAVAAALLLVIFEKRRVSSVRPILAIATVAAGIYVIPTTFDPQQVAPLSPSSKYEITALASNGEHTTYVVDDPSGKSLYIDNRQVASAAASEQTRTHIMAHVPLLTLENPQRALLIGFGVGNTASAIMMHPTIESLEVVEANRSIIETAHVFSRTNFGVRENDRVRFYLDDGGNFLASAYDMYDLIAIDIAPHSSSTPHHYYTQHFYDAAKQHLTPKGLVAQRFAAFTMPHQAVRRAIATFASSFEHTALLIGHGRELILLGSNSPINWQQLEDSFWKRHGVRIDLDRLGVPSPQFLLARLIMLDSQIDAIAANAEIIHNNFDVPAPLSLPKLFARHQNWSSIVEYQPNIVAEQFKMMKSVEAARTLAPIVQHAGRLHYRVPDFPEVFLNAVVNRNDSMKLTNLNWNEINRLRAAANKLVQLANNQDKQVKHKRINQAIVLLHQCLQASPEQPLILLDLARLHVQANQYTAAADALKTFVKIEPNQAIGYLSMSQLHQRSGHYDQALMTARKAATLTPMLPVIHKTIGDILMKLERYDEAAEAYSTAIELDVLYTAAIEGRKEAVTKKRDASIAPDPGNK
jgi:spermidine synthase